MGTVQTVSDPQDPTQLCNHPPLVPGHAGEVGVSPLGKGAPVVPGYVRNHLDLLRRLSTMTHGAFDASAGVVARHTGQTISVRQSADPWLIPLVIALFLGEVFVRRRYLGD